MIPPFPALGVNGSISTYGPYDTYSALLSNGFAWEQFDLPNTSTTIGKANGQKGLGIVKPTITLDESGTTVKNISWTYRSGDNSGDVDFASLFDSSKGIDFQINADGPNCIENASGGLQGLIDDLLLAKEWDNADWNTYWAAHPSLGWKDTLTNAPTAPLGLKQIQEKWGCTIPCDNAAGLKTSTLNQLKVAYKQDGISFETTSITPQCDVTPQHLLRFFPGWSNADQTTFRAVVDARMDALSVTTDDEVTLKNSLVITAPKYWGTDNGDGTWTYDQPLKLLSRMIFRYYDNYGNKFQTSWWYGKDVYTAW